jgi:hypothetical protein
VTFANARTIGKIVANGTGGTTFPPSWGKRPACPSSFYKASPALQREGKGRPGGRATRSKGRFSATFARSEACSNAKTKWFVDRNKWIVAKTKWFLDWNTWFLKETKWTVGWNEWLLEKTIWFLGWSKGILDWSRRSKT